MRRGQTALIILIVIGLPLASFGQAWSGIINPTRAANWQRANVGVPGGIPSGNWTQCGATIAAYGTQSAPASPAAINNAIAACGSNQFVLLGPGTFWLNGGISLSAVGSARSYVVLRGSGPQQTKLEFTAGNNCVSGAENICVANSNGLYAGGTSSSANVLPPCGGNNSMNCFNWTGGYAQGATSITVSNVGASGISNGDVITLDQANDNSDNGGYMVCDSATSGPGGAFIGPLNCHQSSEQSSDGGRCLAGSSCSNSTNGVVEYSQQQWVVVTAGCSSVCSGTGPFTLTISPGLYANNWNGTNATGGYFVKPVRELGVENLTIDNSNGSARGNIAYYNCYGCWIKNVVSLAGNRNHVWLYQNPRTEIRDSYFYGTKNEGSQSYGIEMGEFAGSDILIENNIFQQITGPVVGGGMSGAIIAYNFAIDDAYDPTSYLQGVYVSHDAADNFSLFEGNQIPAIDCDDIHGTPGGLNTYFRNRLNGRDWNQGAQPTQQTYPIDLDSYCRAFNIIGNSLGTPGYHTNYQQKPPGSVSAATCNTTIYELGWGGGICSNLDSAGVADDPVVAASLMRWGNYDTVNAAVRWDATESSPGAIKYIAAQSTPSSHTLPPSFYLSGAPSFFSMNSGIASPPFPPIGPDVASGNGPGGYSYDIPAKKCYDFLGGSSNGSGSPLAFDAGNCYGGGGSQPAPPTNLVATPQ